MRVQFERNQMIPSPFLRASRRGRFSARDETTSIHFPCFDAIVSQNQSMEGRNAFGEKISLLNWSAVTNHTQDDPLNAVESKKTHYQPLFPPPSWQPRVLVSIARPVRQYPCPQSKQYRCEKLFSNRSHASRHCKIHLGIRAVCPDCHKSISRTDNLRAHRRTHRREVNTTRLLEDRPAARLPTLPGMHPVGAGQNSAVEVGMRS